MMNMKRNLTFLIAIAISAIACNPSRSGSDDVYSKAETYDGTSAYAYKYSTSSVDGFDSYGLSIFRGNVGEDYCLDGKGLELYLEFMCPQSSAVELQAGTYKTVLKYDGSNPAYMLSTGCVTDGYIYGSYMEFVPSEIADPEYYVLTEGTVTVAKRGSTYVIEARVIAGGEPFIFNYTGSVETIEVTGGIDIDDDDDDVDTGVTYNFSSFTQGELDYFGSDSGLYYWGIYLGDSTADLEDLSADGSLLCIELATKNSSSTELKTGTYTVSSTDADMTAAALYEVENGYAGTMYCLEDYIVVGASSGTVKVSKSGSNYTIEADLYDAEYDNTFKGSYTGPLTYVDYTQYNRAAKVHGTAKNIALQGKRHSAVRGRM